MMRRRALPCLVMFLIFHPTVYDSSKGKPMGTLVCKVPSYIRRILLHLNQTLIISLSDLRHGLDDLTDPLLSALFALNIGPIGDTLRSRRSIRHS